MKALLGFILLLPLTASFADDANTNNAGPENCGAKMSLKLKSPGIPLGIGHPLPIVIGISNLSNIEILRFVDSDAERDFYFAITLPSGLNVITKQPALKENRRRLITWELGPNEGKVFTFDLNSIISLKEAGSYKLVAKRRIPLPYQTNACEISSNPLDFVLTVSTNVVPPPRQGF